MGKEMDKIILITGASRGIGKALANKIKGKKIVTSRDIKSLDGVGDHPYDLDLSSVDSVKSFAKDINDNFPRVDVLINNAGILGETTNLEESSFETWTKVMDCNINNQFLLIKLLLPLLKKSSKGSIINVSSTVGRMPRENWGAYSVSKAALEALTVILSQELSKYSIIVNSVNPGGPATKMRREAFPDENQSSLPQPEDVVPIFSYLSSDQANETGKQFDARDYMNKEML